MKLPSIPLLLLGILLIASCNKQSGSDPHASHMNHENYSSPAMEASVDPVPAGGITEMSLYNLGSKWATQEGDSIQLEALQGKIQIVAMIYTSCDYACPRLIADLKRIEESLEENQKKETQYLLVTIDPERDTPEKMKEFAEKNRLDAARWTFLTGQETNIMELAALLNVRYRKELSMDIAHSNIISVLNKNGELIHQQEGLGTDPSETVTAITDLLNRL